MVCEELNRAVHTKASEVTTGLSTADAYCSTPPTMHFNLQTFLKTCPYAISFRYEVF